MKSKTKKRRGNESEQPRRLPESGTSWPRKLLLALVVLVAAGGTWAFCEYVLWNKIPSELVGKWVVTEGPDRGGTIDFYRGGSMVGVVNKGGNEAIIHGAIRLDGNKLTITTRNRETGGEGVRTQLIKSVDKFSLVLQDERGTELKLERAN